MPTLDINGREFLYQKLNPFGVEVEPFDGKCFSIEDLVSTNFHSFVGILEEHKLIIFNKAENKRSIHNWDELPPPKTPANTETWHSDGSGKYPAIVWSFGGGVRSPTAYVERLPLGIAMKQYRELLNPVNINAESEDDFINILRRAYEHLSRNAEDIDPQEVRIAYFTLFRDQEFENNRIPNPKSNLSLVIQKTREFLRSLPKEQNSLNPEIRGKCMNAFENFFHSVDSLILPSRTRFQDWSKNPSQIVAFYNGFENTSQHTDNPLVANFHKRSRLNGYQRDLETGTLHRVFITPKIGFYGRDKKIYFS